MHVGSDAHIHRGNKLVQLDSQQCRYVFTRQPRYHCFLELPGAFAYFGITESPHARYQSEDVPALAGGSPWDEMVPVWLG